MYVCVCHGITDRQICRAVDEGASSLCDVQMKLPVGGCCGRCVETAEEIISQHQQHSRNCACRSASAVAGPIVATPLVTAPLVTERVEEAETALV